MDASTNFKPDTLVSNHQIGLNSIFNTNDNTDNSQKAFLHSLSDTTLTKLRTNTFSNWPLITPNVHDMITAGFYYTNIADRVICPHCDILFHKWTETDRPYQIHQLKSPKCPFILTAEKNGTSLQTTPITITSQPSTQITVNTVDSPFALAHRRRETFQSWPSTTKDSLPSIDSFVDAGFHYTGLIVYREQFANSSVSIKVIEPLFNVFIAMVHYVTGRAVMIQKSNTLAGFHIVHISDNTLEKISTKRFNAKIKN